MFDTDGDGKGDYHGGGVGRLDCGLNTADDYTALGHRVALGGEKPRKEWTSLSRTFMATTAPGTKNAKINFPSCARLTLFATNALWHARTD
jgi:hypothetical protein